MKIGILTQPLHNNYGGLLQNFALQQFLRENGHEPVTLDWCHKRIPIWRKYASKGKQWILWKLNKSSRPRYVLTEAESRQISQNTVKFVSKYIHHTSAIASSEEFRKETVERGLQVLIAGSDQVWRPAYSGGHLIDMFFSFAKGLHLKKIAYAVSFGTDKWMFSFKQTSYCRKLVQDFDLVTVREDSGVALCRNHFSVEAFQVLDPTMLHDKRLYEKIALETETPKRGGSLFYYILDPSKEKEDFIHRISNHKDMKSFTVMPTYQAETRTKQTVKREIEKCIFPGVEEWLRAFMDAEMVVCDSFHGCVFSIIFNKPFWVLGNEGRGNARFGSLLKMFGLQERLVSANSEINIDSSINWSSVNTILEEKRIYSKALLLNALKNA